MPITLTSCNTLTCRPLRADSIQHCYLFPRVLLDGAQRKAALVQYTDLPDTNLQHYIYNGTHSYYKSGTNNLAETDNMIIGDAVESENMVFGDAAADTPE